jgi:hypothetical protein
MIIKSLRHKVRSSKYSVNYIFDGLPKERKDQWVIYQNITDGFTRESIIQELNANAEYLSSTLQRKKTIRFHEILAFSHLNEKDLNREKLQRIAHKYLQLRDPDSASLAICVPHIEKHTHIHILLTSNAMGSTKSGDMRMSNARYYEIRRSMERWVLQTYPELHQSTVYLPKEEIHQLLPKKYQAQRRIAEVSAPKQSKGTAKAKVSVLVKEILEKSTSMEDFVKRINKQNGFHTYSRKGKLSGIIHEQKKKYRFSTLGINLLEENFNVLSRMSKLETIHEKKKEISQSRER